MFPNTHIVYLYTWKFSDSVNKNKNRKLLFLDILGYKKPENTLCHYIYRKPTRTHRYLHFTSLYRAIPIVFN